MSIRLRTPLAGGPDFVAEMTGRSERLARSSTDNKFYLQKRAPKGEGKQEKVNIRERDKFQSGQKLIALISDAASTGVSLHGQFLQLSRTFLSREFTVAIC